eukprot:CAMPEP_0170170930 /NCGR_PEP_ID=MMETSP0040_2-20121228/3980_1 /TAXON_ID=641309 /ORGANISM="Lotharella oceanica, Strain CCMP622" /LENGTH=174 /DNA_ID=CAMNT_0010410653 /DNA_START=123 /DNA_END=644 /DNA_ORIENTATION=-
MDLVWGKALEDVTTLWKQPKGQSKMHGKHIQMVANLQLDHVLSGKYEAPFDLSTFGAYCEEEQNEDLLGFLLLVKRLRAEEISDAEFKQKLAGISRLFLEQDSELEINVHYSLKMRTNKNIQKMVAGMAPVKRTVLDAAYSSAFNVLNLNSFVRWRDKNDYQMKLPDHKADAQW